MFYTTIHGTAVTTTPHQTLWRDITTFILAAACDESKEAETSRKRIITAVNSLLTGTLDSQLRKVLAQLRVEVTYADVDNTRDIVDLVNEVKLFAEDPADA